MLPVELTMVLLSVVGNTFVGLFTFYKNPKSATNQLFFFFTLLICLYLAFNYLALHQIDDVSTFFWIKMVISIALGINYLFFLLVYAFPQRILYIDHKIVWSGVVFTITVHSLVLLGMVFKGVVPSTTQPIPGIGISLFLIHTIIFLGGGFFFLINKFRHSQGVERIQIKLFLLGAVLMFTSIIITNVLFVIVLQTTYFVGLLPLYTLIFLGFVSYAIIKHKFLDIRLIVARTITYTLILVILGASYTFAILSIGSSLFSIPFSPTRVLFYGGLTLLVAFTFQSLKTFIEKQTDAIFYKGYYDTHEFLKDISTILSTNIDLQVLTTKVLDKVLSQMRITRGTFVLLEKKSHRNIEFIEYSKYDLPPQFTQDDIDTFLNHNTVLIFDDLEESPVKIKMREINVSIVLPLIVNHEKIGFLFLGEKLSGDVYSQKDIKLIEILAPELSVAVLNSKEYEEIRRFNITLREEVEKATRELTAANTKLKDLDKLKDEFVSLASHELRTPLTAIKSYLWLLLDQKTKSLDEKQHLYIERSYSATERLIKMVNDMLNISRIESGRLTINLEQVELNSLLQDAINELAPTAKKLGVTILFAPQHSPLSIRADPEKTRGVVTNLLGNAIKFTPVNGTITITTTPQNGFIQTAIKDTGKGIAKEDIGKLFQKFEMVGKDVLKRQDTKQGSGLGLYISKSVIELMGGKIWAESEGENKGSTFYFTLKTQV